MNILQKEIDILVTIYKKYGKKEFCINRVLNIISIHNDYEGYYIQLSELNSILQLLSKELIEIIDRDWNSPTFRITDKGSEIINPIIDNENTIKKIQQYIYTENWEELESIIDNLKSSKEIESTKE